MIKSCTKTFKCWYNFHTFNKFTYVRDNTMYLIYFFLLSCIVYLFYKLYVDLNFVYHFPSCQQSSFNMESSDSFFPGNLMNKEYLSNNAYFSFIYFSSRTYILYIMNKMSTTDLSVFFSISLPKNRLTAK